MGTTDLTSPASSRRTHLRRGVFFASIIILLVAGCTKIPDGLQAVTGFDLQRFLGKWYEIARLDHGFEKNLQNVTAEYSPGEDGQIKVINRGFNVKTKQWEEDDAVAEPIGDSDVASLKVSFFGPFWGGYHVIALDQQNYRYAMVTGPNKKLLWILSRDKTLDDKTLAGLISQAGKWGYDTKNLIYVKHDDPQLPSADAAPAAPPPANTR